ncbi:MAG: GNAT family N-acetyltransferase [Candidatus Cloacimonetes bacterium]|nr:GNAT family N-acetyltransferase [Candidatus Cloacimonadota bacterium]
MSVIIREGSAAEAAALAKSIPEFDDPYPEAEFYRRLDKREHLILIACDDNVQVGFMVAYYKQEEKILYCWMAGVVPAYRNRGVATGLIDHQEQWAISHRYHQVEIKTRNKHRNMLRLLLHRDYMIIDFKKKSAVEENSIILRKSLI